MGIDAAAAIRDPRISGIAFSGQAGLLAKFKPKWSRHPAPRKKRQHALFVLTIVGAKWG